MKEQRGVTYRERKGFLSLSSDMSVLACICLVPLTTVGLGIPLIGIFTLVATVARGVLVLIGLLTLERFHVGIGVVEIGLVPFSFGNSRGRSYWRRSLGERRHWWWKREPKIKVLEEEKNIRKEIVKEKLHMTYLVFCDEILYLFFWGEPTSGCLGLDNFCLHGHMGKTIDLQDDTVVGLRDLKTTSIIVAESVILALGPVLVI